MSSHGSSMSSHGSSMFSHLGPQCLAIWVLKCPSIWVRNVQPSVFLMSSHGSSMSSHLGPQCPDICVLNVQPWVFNVQPSWSSMSSHLGSQCPAMGPQCPAIWVLNVQPSGFSMSSHLGPQCPAIWVLNVQPMGPQCPVNGSSMCTHSTTLSFPIEAPCGLDRSTVSVLMVGGEGYPLLLTVPPLDLASNQACNLSKISSREEHCLFLVVPLVLMYGFVTVERSR